MIKRLFPALLMLVMLPALAQEAATSAEKARADAAADKAPSAESAKAAEPGTEAFVPPPGFKVKKQGALTLYCQRDSTVGTRFKTEKCYNQEQMREYLLAREIQKRDIDQVRSTCAGSACVRQ